MNHNHLTTLCNRFELGSPLNAPTRVYGGLLHRMWRVNTDSGVYAVKQLSAHIDLHDEAIVKNYNLTEDIVSRFIAYWMVYNIERSCTTEESEQKALGIQQVLQVMKSIAELKQLIPHLMELLL